MDDEARNSLQMRLTNCLQTILDLEPELERLELSEMLLQEYNVLKSFMDNVDSVDLEEQDVRRIEEATEGFLAELKTPLSLLRKEPPNARGRMH
ncbi:hypothetical protein [Megalodesulfovibrio gigas]|uniref:Uncharacterized protein n=1 Tax=Megalodesulfovibrio gigas (strain ATCC 19364 / DSM 1382 / NCIMB 9332 / VKM B-1759) TaxID=1121448 RepID=T2GDL5_MEGG1|nr:hypothetical protein [Megalodesulfovibrio gigas]AGW14264.1 hypothetical protein DGI_2529 [Megalodesulfovibrio gigas DSM 1382 = ATCC 19364]